MLSAYGSARPDATHTHDLTATLRHSLLLVGALLCTHPLGPDVSVEFGVDLEVVQDTGVV